MELNTPPGDVVAYKVRHDSTTSSTSRIIFMTDGVLVRRLSTAKNGLDMLLPDISCVIIDEAHERSVGSDILIGWLSRIVKLRNRAGNGFDLPPLKLIIMSATLRTADFTRVGLFSPEPPILKVQGRQFKVVVHFQKKTPIGDWCGDVVRKVGRIHTRLPPGAILVFVASRDEVHRVITGLEAEFATTSSIKADEAEIKEVAVAEVDEGGSSVLHDINDFLDPPEEPYESIDMDGRDDYAHESSGDSDSEEELDPKFDLDGDDGSDVEEEKVEVNQDTRRGREADPDREDLNEPSSASSKGTFYYF
jgi:ATP-dependent RNA helicase DHX37/DHR1